MKDAEFQDYLRNEIVKNVSGTRNESTSLLHWLLVNVFDLDPDNATSVICDGKKDKGIDGIHVDTLEEIIFVFQSKYKENNDRYIGDRVLRDFAGVKSWFQTKEAVENLKSSAINEELKSLLSELKIDEIVDDYNVEYHFVSNAIINSDTEEFLSVEKEIFVWDIESLMKHYHLIKDDPLVIDNHTFRDIGKENVIEMNLENGLKTLMVPIKAKELLELKGIDDLTLFSKNVRYGLGNTRVNRAIKNTINNDKENKNFILFHNGISMVCESFDYNKNSKELVAKNYSIVNGAQSILAFYKESDNLNDNIRVILRVTQVGESNELIDLISRYNNNQNSISMKDLRAKDKIQNRLTRQFEELNKKYDLKISYSAKRGKVIPEGNDLILSDYAAQLIESCYFERSYNIHLKASLFDSKYNEIFNKNIDALKITMYFKSHCVLKTILDKIEDKGVADYGLAQHFLIMVMFDVINSSEKLKILLRDEEKYMSSIEKWNKAFESILSMLIRGLNKEIRELQTNWGHDFIYKNFFKSKENIEKLHNEVRGSFEMIQEMFNNSIENMVDDVGIPL